MLRRLSSCLVARNRPFRNFVENTTGCEFEIITRTEDKVGLMSRNLLLHGALGEVHEQDRGVQA